MPTAKSEADTKFLSGRSTGSPVDKSKAEGLAGFRAVKLSKLKKATSVDAARNRNPLLPTAFSETPRFEPSAPTEERGQETVVESGSPDVPAFAVDEEDAGGAIGKGQEFGIKSHFSMAHRENEQMPDDRTVSHGKQQRNAWQRPKTADAALPNRAAGTSANSTPGTSESPASAWASEHRKRQRPRDAGLTVATTGLSFDRRDAGPVSPFASPITSTSTSHGCRRSTTVPGCRGMAASPEGTFLLHRLRGLATTRRLSAMLGPTSPQPQDDARPRTNRSQRVSEGRGGARACRAHPDPAGIQLFPWGVSPQSPRGKLIVHQSRLPQ